MTLLGQEKILATWFLRESAWSHHTFYFLLDINPLSSKLCCSHDIPTKQLQLIRATLHNLLWSIFEIGLTRWCALFFSLPLSLYSLWSSSSLLLLSSSSWSCSSRKVCELQIPMWYMYTLWADCLYLTLNVLMFELLEITQRNLKLLKPDSKKPLQLASTSTWQYIWFTNKWLFYLSFHQLAFKSKYALFFNH